MGGASLVPLQRLKGNSGEGNPLIKVSVCIRKYNGPSLDSWTCTHPAQWMHPYTPLNFYGGERGGTVTLCMTALDCSKSG